MDGIKLKPSKAYKLIALLVAFSTIEWLNLVCTSRRLALTWFLKFDLCWLSVCVCVVCVLVCAHVHSCVCICVCMHAWVYVCACACVCVSLRLLITSGEIWTLYDWLNKFYSCYMATVAVIINGCGLGIDIRCGN